MKFAQSILVLTILLAIPNAQLFSANDSDDGLPQLVPVQHSKEPTEQLLERIATLAQDGSLDMFMTISALLNSMERDLDLAAGVRYCSHIRDACDAASAFFSQLTQNNPKCSPRALREYFAQLDTIAREYSATPEKNNSNETSRDRQTRSELIAKLNAATDALYANKSSQDERGADQNAYSHDDTKEEHANATDSDLTTSAHNYLAALRAHVNATDTLVKGQNWQQADTIKRTLMLNRIYDRVHGIAVTAYLGAHPEHYHDGTSLASHFAARTVDKSLWKLARRNAKHEHHSSCLHDHSDSSTADTHNCLDSEKEIYTMPPILEWLKNTLWSGWNPLIFLTATKAINEIEKRKLASPKVIAATQFATNLYACVSAGVQLERLKVLYRKGQIEDQIWQKRLSGMKLKPHQCSGHGH